MSPWIYLRFLFLPALVIVTGIAGTWWNFSVPVICFVIHPLISLLTKQKESSHEEKETEHKSGLYRVIPLLFVPVLLVVTSWAVIQSLVASTVEFIGLTLSVGIVNGILGFTIAHELTHQHSRLEKFAAQVLLIQNSYCYYGIEHIGGHHVYACTPKDPHTARMGESLYHFLPRAIKHTFLNAWEIELNRLNKKRNRVISMYNRMLKLILLQLFVYLFILLFAGWTGMFFFILQGMVAILILNITGYLQHYGLVRKKISEGRFEKISAQHAWTSAKGNDGLNLFHVDRHADHHMHPSHVYQQLVAHDDSPEQPTGYSGMMWLALAPPLWFRVMNKRILSATTKTE